MLGNGMPMRYLRPLEDNLLSVQIFSLYSQGIGSLLKCPRINDPRPQTISILSICNRDFDG